jgi:hypothetical protein
MKHNYMDSLAIKYKTDKYNSHWYTQHYDHHFKKFKSRKINLLEIGVGGNENPYAGGNSLRMWKEYFKKARIYAIDVFEKIGIEEDRIRVFKGSQADEEFLKEVCGQIGPIDIIIDDGSHINCHVINSFRILFPLLKTGGIYVVEDTQTAYWPYEGYGGDSDNLNNPSTSMSFFKSLTDGLNYKEYIRPGYKPNYFDMNIISIHFYHNIIFIYKGINNEESNIILNNSIEHLINLAPKKDKNFDMAK